MSNQAITPKCPNCGYEFDSDETWHSNYSDESKVNTGNGNDSEIKCHNDDCGKVFRVICEYVPVFNVDEDYEPTPTGEELKK